MQPPSNIKKILYYFLADFIFVIHLAVILIVSFGWLIPSLFYIFIIIIISSILSEIYLHYCFLSKLEFGIRKKIDPTRIYDKSCIIHYTRVLFGLGPRIPSKQPQHFLKRNTFIFILLGIFVLGISYRIF